MMLAALFANWLEAPRELLIDTGLGAGFAVFGAWLGVKHVIRPARAHREEVRAELDVRRQREDDHNAWAAEHLAAIYRKQLKAEPEPHPHYDLTGGPA